jgi:hypothetical protein
LWKMNLHPCLLLSLLKRWNLLQKNQWSTNNFHWQVKCSKIQNLTMPNINYK